MIKEVFPSTYLNKLHRNEHRPTPFLIQKLLSEKMKLEKYYKDKNKDA